MGLRGLTLKFMVRSVSVFSPLEGTSVISTLLAHCLTWEVEFLRKLVFLSSNLPYSFEICVVVFQSRNQEA